MSIHDWSKVPDWANWAYYKPLMRGTSFYSAYKPGPHINAVDLEQRPESEEKQKTLHDWSKAPDWAAAARSQWPDCETEWLSRVISIDQNTATPYRYEERPAVIKDSSITETCEEQEAWDALQEAKRQLLEQRKREAHAVRSDHPQKAHAEQLIGSALASQEGGNHYKDMAIQPVEYITKNSLGFIEGCVIKYVSRHRAKNGAEDVKKAIHFLQLLLELEYGNV